MIKTLEMIGFIIASMTIWSIIGFSAFGFFIGCVFDPNDKDANKFWPDMVLEGDARGFLLAMCALGVISWILVTVVIISERDKNSKWEWHFPYVFNSKEKEFLAKLES